ncbi:DUF4169 domain-containing protein [Paramagnetospirillum kuznetsovii]|uniref:DUF4169 domain-containing protein n=1 Tax=Paramagnetospirillum kuznetsovii TaxID=2053833 RepID=A0A364NWR4_9PROT|nr:DUF4169 family protein [Paramagnetospirillum kuznetsovii]RAU21539.1 DUF4169 domain-containing protein [Paramagnetospirillum kuznetsovii]
MAEIINLNRVRKTKAKEKKAAQADTNRVVFGRTRAEREAIRKGLEKAKDDLNGKKLEE